MVALGTDRPETLGGTSWCLAGHWLAAFTAPVLRRPRLRHIGVPVFMSLDHVDSTTFYWNFEAPAVMAPVLLHFILLAH